MAKKIKILHILWFGRSGGAQRFVRDIIKYSDKDKFDHAVCFLSDGGAAAPKVEGKSSPRYRAFLQARIVRMQAEEKVPYIAPRLDPMTLRTGQDRA